MLELLLTQDDGKHAEANQFVNNLSPSSAPHGLASPIQQESEHEASPANAVVPAPKGLKTEMTWDVKKISYIKGAVKWCAKMIPH